MKVNRLLALCAAVAASVALISCGAPEPVAKASWTKDFEAAKAEAKKSGKLLMVDFNATWCGPCQLYKSEVFPTDDFNRAAKDFVLVEIDTDEQPDLAKRYGVGPIPDIRMMDADGYPVGKVLGYAGAEGLLAEMKRVKQKS